MMRNKLLLRAFSVAAALAFCATFLPPAGAQDLMKYFDLTTDESTKADMSRADLEAALKAPRWHTRLVRQAPQCSRSQRLGFDTD
jgi:hypothetical protein